MPKVPDDLINSVVRGDVQKLDDLEDAKNQRLRSSVRGGLEKNPDQYAKVVKQARDAELPPSVVESNPEEVMRSVKQNQIDFPQIQKDTPAVTTFLSNPDNASISHDDIPNLQKMEGAITPLVRQNGFVSDIAGATIGGYDDLRTSSVLLGMAFGGIDLDEGAEIVREGDRRSKAFQSQRPDYKIEFDKVMDESGGDIQKGWRQYISGLESFKRGHIFKALADYKTGEFKATLGALEMISGAVTRPKGLLHASASTFAHSTPNMIGAGVGMVVGGLPGMVIGGFMGGVLPEIGASIREDLDRRGIPLENIRLVKAVFQDPDFIDSVKARAVRKGVTTAGIESITSIFAGKRIAKAVMTPGKTTVQKVGKILKSGLTDVGQEMVQEAGSEFAGQVVKELSFSEANLGDAIFEGIVSLGQSGTTTGLGALVKVKNIRNELPSDAIEGTIKLQKDFERSQIALFQAQALVEMEKVVAESKVNQRDPAKVQELVDEVAGKDGDGKVYFHTDDIDAYAESIGMNPVGLSEAMSEGGGKEYSEAKATGGEMEVRLGDYVTNTSNTPHFEGLLPSVRTESGGMSVKEGKDFQVSLPLTLQELANESEVQMADEESEKKKVRKYVDGLSKQLREAGENPASAGLHGQMILSMSQRYQIPFQELADSYPLELSGVGTVASPQVPQPGVAPLLEEQGKKDFESGKLGLPTGLTPYPKYITDIVGDVKTIGNEHAKDDEILELLREDIRTAVAQGQTEEEATAGLVATMEQQMVDFVQHGEDVIKGEINGKPIPPTMLVKTREAVLSSITRAGHFVYILSGRLTTPEFQDMHERLRKVTSFKPRVFFQRAFHGTPTGGFGQFDPQRAGLERGTIRGWGVYFTDTKDLAKSYREKKDQVKDGVVIEAEIPNDEDLMLWDENVKDMSPKIQKAMEALFDKGLVEEVDKKFFLNETSGEQIYDQLTRTQGSEEGASKALKAVGIVGHKYDENGESSSFVIWDENAIEIIKEFGGVETPNKGSKDGVSWEVLPNGSVIVSGDLDRAQGLVKGAGIKAKGTKKGDTLRFSSAHGPRVVSALSGEDLSARGSRAGVVSDHETDSKGKIKGVSPKMNTPKKMSKHRALMMKLTKEGEPFKFWYERAGDMILKMANGDVKLGEKLSALFAIYSQGTAVGANMTNTLKAWFQFLAKVPIKAGRFGSQDVEAQNVMEKGMAFFGEKRSNFFINLMRNIDPGKFKNVQGATIDLWMMRAFGYTNLSPTDQQYRFVEIETNRIAKELGWEPQQVQASIWTAMKSRAETQSVKDKTDEIGLKVGDFKWKAGSDGKPARHFKDKEAEVRHFERWAKNAFAVTLTPEALAEAGRDFSDFVDNYRTQVSVESRPGSLTGMFPDLATAPKEVQAEYHEKIMSAFTDKDGSNIVAKIMKLPWLDSYLGPGLWEGEVSPGTQLEIATAPRHKPDSTIDKRTLPEFSKKAIRAFASIMGDLLAQDAVGWHRAFYGQSPARANMMDWSIGRRPLDSEMVALYNELDSIITEAGIEGLNPGDIGVVPSVDGFHFLNFAIPTTDVKFDHKKWHDLAVTAVTLALPDDVRAEAWLQSSETGLLENDWGFSPDGQDYKSIATEAGFAKEFGEARTLLSPVLQEIRSQFAKDHGLADPERPAERADDRERRRDRKEKAQRLSGPLSESEAKADPVAGRPKGSADPVGEIRASAVKYNASVPIPYRRPGSYIGLTGESKKDFKKRGKKLAEAYEAMKHNPNDPEVKKAYEALIKETLAQYQEIKKLGIKIERIPKDATDPYDVKASPMIKDVRSGHLWFLATEDSFGQDGAPPADHPMLAPTNEVLDGKPLLANDVFRIVHDLYGHAKEGHSFGPTGEENAWQSHVRMYSPLAGRAMTTETRGQNSWVSFGPQSGQEVTVFAEQKAGLLPEELFREGLADDGVRQFFHDEDGGTNEPRAKITFGKEGPKVNIDFLKTANLASALHEFGHLYFIILQDIASRKNAPANAKEDIKVMLEWVGADSVANLTDKQNEQFARGWEAYIRRGKAPSKALRGAFARFRAWLTNIYENESELRANLTDEVVDVFDRMLASDKEIAEMRNDQNANHLFTDPRGAGMTKAQAERYETAVEDARLSAQELLTARLMADEARGEQEFFQQEKLKFNNMARETVASAPIYQAMRQLQSDETVAGFEVLKLDREQIVKMYGEDIAKKLPKGIYAVGEVQTAQAQHPDVIAGMFQYKSGKDLFTIMSTMVTEKQAIEQLTDQLMAEAHPDIMQDPTKMFDEALEAVYNDKQAEVNRLELQHLASNNLPSLKDVVRRVTRAVPRRQDMIDASIRIVAGKTVRELRPDKYARASAKAGAEAGSAVARGDFEEAFRQKQIELLNTELYRVAKEAKNRVAKLLKLRKKFFQADEKLAKSRDMDLVTAVRAIVASFGLGKMNKKPSEILSQLERFDPELFKEVNQIVIDATTRSADYRDITYDDFVAMADVVERIWTISRRSRQMKIDGQVKDRKEIVEQLNVRILEMTPEKEQAKYVKAKTTWEKAKIYLMGARSALRRVESWITAMDGKFGGPFREFIWNPIREATDNYRLERVDAVKDLLAIVEGVRGTLTNTPILATELVNREGKPYEFAGKVELLHALLHTGNDSNKQKLLRGKGWGDFNDDGTLNTTQWDEFVARMWKEGVLTKADYDFAQGVWDLLESYKPRLQQAHKEMFGHFFSEVTANEVTTPYGKYKGGYVPARVDPFEFVDANQKQDQDALEKTNNTYSFPTAGRGATKARVEGFAQPLQLDLQTLPMHLDWVLRFIHIEPRVRDAGRLLNDSDFKASMDEFDPTVRTDMLTPWLQATALQTVSTPSSGRAGKLVDIMARFLRRQSGLNIMVTNISVASQQFTGFSIAMVKTGVRPWRNHFWKYVRQPARYAEDAVSKSKFMQTRTHVQVVDIQSRIDDIILNPGKYDVAKKWADENGRILTVVAQNIVDIVTWGASYDNAIKAGDSEKDAVRQADSNVRETQGSFDPEDSSRIERGTAFTRMFTMFYSFFNMNANLMGTEFGNTIQNVGLRKGAGRLFFVYTMSFMLPAFFAEMIVGAIAGRLDEDDDDEYLDDIVSSFFMGQIRMGTAMIPGVGTVINAGINQWNDKWYDDRMSTSPVVSQVESAVRSPKSVYKAIVDNGSKRRAVIDGLTAISFLSRLPFTAFARPLGYLADVSDGKAEPTGPIDLTRGLLSGKSGTKK